MFLLHWPCLEGYNKSCIGLILIVMHSIIKKHGQHKSTLNTYPHFIKALNVTLLNLSLSQMQTLFNTSAADIFWRKHYGKGRNCGKRFSLHHLIILRVVMQPTQTSDRNVEMDGHFYQFKVFTMITLHCLTPLQLSRYMLLWDYPLMVKSLYSQELACFIKLMAT